MRNCAAIVGIFSINKKKKKEPGMVSSLLLHTNWAPPPLHGNDGRRTAAHSRSISHLSSSPPRSSSAFQRISSPLLSWQFPAGAQKRGNGGAEAAPEENQLTRISLQASLWAAESAYIIWLFILPYAPGDPVWAIKWSTINDLVALSLNFFFILPLANLVGIHVIQEPVLHPVAESLFNFVLGWTLLFAPLLFTDRRRGSFKGSLDLLWGCQMFLTNAFLIPYMAIRLDDSSLDGERSRPKPTQLGSLMTTGARAVGVIGGIVCLVSIIWALVGRSGGGFGDVMDRWQFLEGYVRSERLAYAFILDIFLYAIFQPWLIGDNLENVKRGYEGLVGALRFVPAFGLVAYLLCLDDDRDL